MGFLGSKESGAELAVVTVNLTLGEGSDLLVTGHSHSTRA
jgi:hypothetical protein